MPPPTIDAARRHAALLLLRQLRRLDDAVGVRHSGIARDVGLLLYEHAGVALQVNQISASTGYSGPTVRLVLARLGEAGALEARAGRGKARTYSLSDRGRAGFDAYVEAIWAFAEGAAVSGEGDPATAPDPQ
jgi:DNA-binding transcriptional ArsR family regulator